MEIIQYCSLVRTLDRDAVLRLAATKWAEIASFQPELAASAVLQQRILTIVLDAAETLGDAPLFVLPPESIAAKWDRSLPALHNEPITIPPRLKDALRPLCTGLAEGGAGDSALHIRDALATGSIDADSLLRVSLARNPAAMRTSALHMGFSPDLLWLIGELGSSPLAHRLASALEKGVGCDFPVVSGKITPDPFFEWDRGYCPCCGSWPVLIEAIADLHTLRCSYCTLGWHLGSRRCAYCGHSGEQFIVAAPDLERPERTVELCGACGGYTKVIRVEAATPFPLLAIDDLATMDLDRGAMERGYRRPEMFEASAIEAFRSC